MAKGLTERQEAMLEGLRQNGGQASDQDLAIYLGTTLSAIRGIMNRLEDRGLLAIHEGHSRMPCSGGGKYVLAVLVEQKPPAEGGASR